MPTDRKACLFKLPEQTRLKLKTIAKVWGCSMTEVIVRLVSGKHFVNSSDWSYPVMTGKPPALKVEWEQLSPLRLKRVPLLKQSGKML